MNFFISRGFLSPKAARFTLLGGDRMVFIGALPYNEKESEGSVDSDLFRGQIAPFARRNYYRTAVLQLKEIISVLCSSMEMNKQDTSIFCNSRLPEKAMAASSGVGVYGKNGLILVPETGSLCIIAGFSMPSSLLMEKARLDEYFPLLSIDRDTLIKKAFSRCGTCKLCISACPTLAITSPGTIDRNRCIQNLATSTEVIPEAIMEKWGFTIYGCQVCQGVCPENRNPVKGFQTHEGEIGASVPLEKFLTSDSREIKKLVKKTVMDRKWIPPEALMRNALIAAGNSRNRRLIRFIEPYLNDSRRFIRETASWAYRKTTSTVS